LNHTAIRERSLPNAPNIPKGKKTQRRRIDKGSGKNTTHTHPVYKTEARGIKKKEFVSAVCTKGKRQREMKMG